MYSLCSANYIFCTLGKAGLYNAFLESRPASRSARPKSLGISSLVIPRAQALLHPPAAHGGISTRPQLRGGAALRAAWRFAQSRASARMLVPPPSGSSRCAADQHRGIPLLALRPVVSVSMALSACHRDLLTAVPQFSTALFLLTARCLPFLEFISHPQSQR